MEQDHNRPESVYTGKLRAGKRRTYFFDIRPTRNQGFYITLTESTRRQEGEGYIRNKIFIYKEDLNQFIHAFESCVKHMKEELMPEYDYDEFTKRQEEWEAQRALELSNNPEDKPERLHDESSTASKDKADDETEITW